MIENPKEHPLYKAAERWMYASKAENRGMGSASGMMARSTDNAVAEFQRLIRETRPIEICNLLLALGHPEASR
jgi:hypothetical protein